MRTVLRIVISIFVLMMGAAALPAAASEQPLATGGLQSAVLAPNISVGPLPNTVNADSGCLTLGELVAIVAGAVVVGSAADIALGSGPFAFLGMVAGAALGSIWYKQGI